MSARRPIGPGRGRVRVPVLPAGYDAAPATPERFGPNVRYEMPSSVRVAMKLFLAAGLIVVLLLFAGTEVDFVYAGF